jgi:hypothetical protein
MGNAGGLENIVTLVAVAALETVCEDAGATKV